VVVRRVDLVAIDVAAIAAEIADQVEIDQAVIEIVSQNVDTIDWS
jgi:hypothetical protein